MAAVTAEDILQSTPVDKKNDGETVEVIRPLTEEEKQIYTVLFKLCVEARDLKREHQLLHDSEECPKEHSDDVCEKMQIKEALMKGRIDLLRNLMWESIRISLATPEKDAPLHLRVQADWQVITIEENKSKQDESETDEEGCSGCPSGRVLMIGSSPFSALASLLGGGLEEILKMFDEAHKAAEGQNEEEKK